MGKKTEGKPDGKQRERAIAHTCGLHDSAPPALSAEELASRARRGCEACYAELVRRYAGRLLGFLRQKTAGFQDAEDLTQETFVKAYQNIGRYQKSSKFSTWLFTIASRLASSHYRRRKYFQRIGEVESGDTEPGDMMLQAEAKQNLWATAKSLSKNQYEALWLRYAEDMSIKEIAKVMRKSQVNVKVLLYRARTKLAERLSNETEEDRTTGEKSSDETLPFLKMEGA